MDTIPLFIDAEISSPGWLRSPLALLLTLQNNSEELLNFDLNMDHTEGEYFMFSGCKKVSFGRISIWNLSLKYTPSNDGGYRLLEIEIYTIYDYV